MTPLGEQVYDPQPGTPYRSRWYGNGSKAHLIHRDDETIFWCGRMVWPEPSILDSAGIEEWHLSLDGRKNPQVCGDCKKREKAWKEVEGLRRRLALQQPAAFFEHTVHLDNVAVIARQWRMEEWESTPSQHA